jgi:polyribonucleotide nucleotidyltransferase
MVESQANELTEDQMLGAVLFAHQEMQVVIKAVNELKAEVGKDAWEWQAAEVNTALVESVSEKFAAGIAEAYKVTDKMDRQNRLGELRDQAVEELAGDEGPDADEVRGVFGGLEKKTVRRAIVAGEPRIDGRDTKTVRAIDVEVGLLPRAHGSALFTRG